MRSTVRLDDDVHRAVKELAASRGTTLGVALSEAVRRGIRSESRGGDLPVFDVPDDAPLITSEHVRELLDDEV